MTTAIVGYVLLVLWTIYVLGLGILLGAVVLDPEIKLSELGADICLLLAVAFLLWPFAVVIGLILDEKEKPNSLT